MGYDIEARLPKTQPTDLLEYLTKDQLQDWQIAVLAMGSRAKDAPIFFKALGASDFDGQVSGNGAGRCFDAATLEAATRTLCDEYLSGRLGSVRTLAFVAQVLSYLEGRDGWIHIRFF